MRRWISQGAIFGVLFFMSIGVPLMIQAIFPDGSGSSAQETSLDSKVSAQSEQARRNEDQRLAQNYAWLRGEQGSSSVLDTTTDEASLSQAEEREQREALDLSPGVFARYNREWDNLDIRREQSTVGAFVYLPSYTKLQGSVANLKFKDDVDTIRGHAGRFDVAQLLPKNWLLEAGIERDVYNHLFSSWNGDAKISGAVSSNVAVSFEGGRQDIWERLQTIRDRVRQWFSGVSFYYQFLPRWWLSGFGNAGWYSDHNKRGSTGGEVGTLLSDKYGFSISGGAETTTFSDQKNTYWSPSFYTYTFGRLRWTKNYETSPFQPKRSFATTAERIGYIAEYTAGVNDDGHFEHSVRSGVRYHATPRLSFDADYFHLESNGRFSTHYSENRLQVGAELRF